MDKKKNQQKGDSLDSLFASSNYGDEVEDKSIKEEKNIKEKSENKLKEDSKKRKINDVLKPNTKKEKNNKQENGNWYNFTSKYAYEFEYDAKKAKREKMEKDGKYLFLYKHSGKNKDNVSTKENNNNRKRKNKKSRDPNFPKKYKTAFFQFLHEERDKAKKKFTEIKNNKELMQKLGEIWKNFSTEKREKYVNMEKKDKERYDLAIKDYKEKIKN